MLKIEHKQMSLYSTLYNKIPENHILKLINKSIDFSFINDLLEGSYCKYYGRPAKEPELMLRILVLQYLYNLSDERVIEEASLNLAHMYFLGINPEDELPHPSLLAKFRVHKLHDITLDEIIVMIVNQCIEKGIINGSGISIDTTHSKANTHKATPERVMKHLAKKIFKTISEEMGEIPEIINQEIPDYKKIEDNKQAKLTMKVYLEETIKKAEENIELERNPKTKQQIENAKKILKNPKFIKQKGVRSLVDQDARVGHKSKTENFFGYKTEYIITTEERIITAVRVNDGAYVDGTQFNELIELTRKSKIPIAEVYGDKAYFKKGILDKVKEIKAEAYIPVSEMAYKLDGKYSYNKDSDEWFCKEGNNTVKRKHKQYKSGKQSYKYYFEKEKCKNCLQKENCIKGKAKAKILEIGINTPEFYEYSIKQKTEEFKIKYKKRACQEWKNGEMKNFHGLDRARGYGLKSMSTQSKLTALAVNLKRIANILSSKNYQIFTVSLKILKQAERLVISVHSC